MQEPPAGTLTLLFSDVEGSTALLNRLGEQYGQVLSAQRALLRAAFREHRGRELGTEGDSFFVVFESAGEAVRCCVAAQRALAGYDWPCGEPVRVRMGLHSGEPVRHEDGYIGLDVHRAARIAATAHGGQVVLSAATRHLVGSQLPAGVSLRDLGWHWLKDFEAPERIYQLVAADLEERFPPLKSLGAAQATLPRLPVPADSFIGRDRELAEVGELAGRYRLVTLTGPGGCGKTRLATEVARLMAADGGTREVFFVDAGPLADAALIPDRLARAIGVRPGPGQSAAEALSAALPDREWMAVLDNLEHLAGAAAIVAGLLQMGPQLHLLVTSRAPLHARGEHVYPVPPLPVPGLGAGPPGPAGAAAAVALFADRAAAADPRFEITAENAGVVAEVCRQLDGLPLAIELAAGRARVLPPELLLARLDRRLDLLTETGGDRPSRQQTLRAAIDWSYQLLDEATRQTFRALAVFRGGWSAPAAAVVCDRADDVTLLGQLGTLADASLIEPAGLVAGEQRFRMLESLREFALEQLSRHGEEEMCRERHADFVYALAADAAPHLTGEQQISYLDKLEPDRDNISSALRWLAARGQIERGLQTAALVWRFWHLRAHLEEGRALLEALVTGSAAALDAAVRADGLTALGSIVYWQLNYTYAQQLYEEALAAYTKARVKTGIALSHYNLGFTAVIAGDNASARRHFERALAGYDDLADQLGRGNALAGLALVDRATGDYERGRRRAADGLALQRSSGDDFGATNSLSLLGSITSQMGRVSEAEAMFREALISHERSGNMSGIGWMLHELAATAVTRGQPERAILLSGAARSLEGRLGGGIPVHVLHLAERINTAWDQLDTAQAERARDHGRLMSQQQAIAAALTDPQVSGLPPEGQGSGVFRTYPGLRDM
jgi:predicted ATPase/class 3 adenylate cyclase